MWKRTNAITTAFRIQNNNEKSKIIQKLLRGKEERSAKKNSSNWKQKNKNQIEMWANPKLNKILKYNIISTYISIVVVIRICQQLPKMVSLKFLDSLVFFFCSSIFSIFFFPSIFLFYWILLTVSTVRKSITYIIIHQYSSIQ